MENPPKKKRNPLIRLILFLAAAALVAGAASLVIFRDELNMDALRRWYTYRSLTLSDSGQAQSFPYAGSSDDVFADVDGDLLVCSGNSVSLYSGSGVQYIDLQVSFSAPAVAVSGNTAAVYDAGGSSLHLIRERAVAWELTSQGSLLSAHLNGDGFLTVVSQESGYRGVVTVYDREGDTRAALRLSSAYILDAVLDDGGSILSVVTIGQEGGAFRTVLSLYDLGAVAEGAVSYDVTPLATASLGSGVILDLEWEDGICALGDTGLWRLDGSGAVQGSLLWSDRYLKAFSLAGDGFSVALLGRYRAGSQSDLYICGADGALIGVLPLEEQVLALDAAGNYFAVLTADRLDIYTAGLELYSSLSGTQSARKVLLRPDGSAMLISAGDARLYVPS